MPELASPARRTTRTTTETTELPSENGIRGLGGPVFDYLDHLPDEHIGLTDVWIYRTDPPGQQTYVKKLFGATAGNGIRIDEEWIRASLGGGTYRVKVTTKGIASGFQNDIRVDGAPKIAGETPAASAAPVNDSALTQLVDLIREQNARLERVLDRQTAPPPQPNAATEAAIGVVADGAKKVIELVASSVKPPAAPASPLSDLTTIMAFVEKLKPQESDVDKALKQALIAQLTNPKKSLLDEIRGLAEIREVVTTLGGGGGKGDWKDTLIEKGIDQLPAIVDKVGNMFASNQRRAEAEAARAASFERIRAASIGQPGAAPPQTLQPGAAPQAPRPAAPASAQPADVAGPWGGPLEVDPTPGLAPGVEVIPPGAQPAAPAADDQPMAMSYDDGVKLRIVELIGEGAEPDQVLDFIDSAVPQIGASLTHATEEQVRQFIASDLILRTAENLPQWEAWFPAFLALLAESREQLPVERVQ